MRALPLVCSCEAGVAIPLTSAMKRRPIVGLVALGQLFHCSLASHIETKCRAKLVSQIVGSPQVGQAGFSGACRSPRSSRRPVGVLTKRPSAFASSRTLDAERASACVSRCDRMFSDPCRRIRPSTIPIFSCIRERRSTATPSARNLRTISSTSSTGALPTWPGGHMTIRTATPGARAPRRASDPAARPGCSRKRREDNNRGFGLQKILCKR